MRRLSALALALALLLASGHALSQTGDNATPAATDEVQLPPAFAVVGEIGRALPRAILYEPLHERMAVVDAHNRLLLVNALDYRTLAVLHERGEYQDFAFSHDGRWLAVIVDMQVEIWDTESRQMVAQLGGLGNAKQLTGPLAFSSDDRVLLFYGIYPAPRQLRQKETDSITYPWMWHLGAARKEESSTFPKGVQAVQMVDYPNGFFLSPDNKIVAALPGRLRILDAFTLQPIFDIPTERYEQDPLQVWSSLRDNRLYVSPVNFSSLIQVNTQRGALVEIPINNAITQNDLSLINQLELGSAARIIGGQASRQNNPLLQRFLGNYRDSNRYGSDRLTVTLIDLVVPPASAGDNVRALLFVYDEDKGQGTFQFSWQEAASQMVLSPDGQDVLLRRNEGEEQIITFNLDSGQEIRRFLPALRAIGAYSRFSKNRVLAYDQSGKTLISDFQRIDAQTNQVVFEDLRYSQQFERFYFSQDSQKLITLAGSEWREWDFKTGKVLRREVVHFPGTVIATSSDGYRFLSQNEYSSGVSVTDLATGNNYSVGFAGVPGSGVAQIVPNADWTRFLVVYSSNPYGPYAPGNQIALYDYREGQKWLIAGDDLPPANQRRYGWVDANTVYVYGQGLRGEQPARVYGVQYAPNGLPDCIVRAYPQEVPAFTQLWERLVLSLRVDKLDALSAQICQQLPSNAAEVEQLLLPTTVATQANATGVPIEDVPQCLTARYPGEADRYAQVWKVMTANASPAEARRLADLLCQGIGTPQPEGTFDPAQGQVMFIDAQTGLRSTGDYREPAVEQTPLQPIYDLFEKTEKRPLGNAILSPDQELVAASSLPGELTVYQMLVPYRSLTAQLTATASVQLEQANLIRALPSPSSTYSVVGTPRPTLTPTPAQTLYPRPAESAFNDGPKTTALCPSEKLYSISQPPASYQVSGQLYAQVNGEYLWSVQPEDGSRQEDKTILQCTRGVSCQISPDNSWILADTYDSIFIVRPDNSDPRTLWDKRTPVPPTPMPQDLHWSGSRALEWTGPVPVTPEAGGRTVYLPAIIRDVLNVYPDPKPWFAKISINQIATEFISRQPGGPWAVAYTTYNTGLGVGYKYYLYHTETGIYQLFAQSEYNQISIAWHPLGDRLYYRFPNDYPGTTYQVSFPDLANRIAANARNGAWSNDGRYVAYSTQSNTQPVGVWDSYTGTERTYCLPETGVRAYGGPFTWSPDGRYLALIAPLPKDESKEGVGAHTLILNVETGEVVDLTTGIVQIVLWAQEPGTYGDGRVVTPTATVTFTPSPTP